MRRLGALLIGLAVVSFAPELRAEEVVEPSAFTELLQTYADSRGQVDYAAWKENEEDVQRLEGYLEHVAEADPESHDRDERLAFYLNAYNATVIRSILDHWPTDSPQSVDGFFKGEKHEIAGESMTLDALEHQLIRPRFDEPRIHFVLVCAAKSCPRLRRTALTGDDLEATLDSAAREFIPRVTELQDGTVVTSKLFEWFSGDFEEAAGSVREYLGTYTDGEVQDALKKKDVEIEMRGYDWTVNKQ